MRKITLIFINIVMLWGMNPMVSASSDSVHLLDQYQTKASDILVNDIDNLTGNKLEQFRSVPFSMKDGTYNEFEKLQFLLFADIAVLNETYDLEIRRITKIPDFLEDFYSKGITPNLYLISAVSKEGLDLIVQRIHFFFDLDLEFSVGTREYFRAEGKPSPSDTLSIQMVVKEFKVLPEFNSLAMPVKGLVTGHSADLAELVDPWQFDIEEQAE